MGTLLRYYLCRSLSASVFWSYFHPILDLYADISAVCSKIFPLYANARAGVTWVANNCSSLYCTKNSYFPKLSKLNDLNNETMRTEEILIDRYNWKMFWITANFKKFVWWFQIFLNWKNMVKEKPMFPLSTIHKRTSCGNINMSCFEAKLNTIQSNTYN